MTAAPPGLLLLVEDDARSAKILARMLREDGLEVEVVVDGAAAIGRLARPPLPSVLITDVRLPHVDGIAVARYARSLDPKIPVILTTSYVQQAIEAEKHVVPAPSILAKPFEYPALRQEIQRLMGIEPSAPSVR